MNEGKINHLAAIVSIVLMHVLGFLWYGVIFQEQWSRLVGITPENMDGRSVSNAVWLLNFLAIAGPIYALAWMFSKLNIDSGIKGLGIALVFAFVFTHLPQMNSNMFGGAPYGLAWINGGYTMTGLAIAGFILGAWKKKG